MKKWFALMTAILCLVASASAESVPSKSTADMTIVEIQSETLPEDSEFFVLPVTGEDTEAYAEHLAFCQAEIENLMAAETVEAHFADVTDVEGNPVSLTEYLETETLNVYEFMPIVIGNYDAAYGSVTLTFQFTTPYEVDQKVLVLIGMIDEETKTMKWIALEGLGVGTDGGIQVEFPPEVLEAIQNGLALMAIISQ